MRNKRLWIKLLAAAFCLIALHGASGAVSAEEDANHYYITPYNFKSFGSWTLSGDFLQGRVTAPSIGEANGSGGVPAVAEVNITNAGEYRLWVRDRDFATNSPGIRTFHVGVDGVLANRMFGNHGQEGFRWTEVGIYELEQGVHELELHDTSGFYARSEGFFLSDDLDLVPPEDKEELLQIVQPYNPLDELPSAEFPAWAKGAFTPTKTAAIENDSVKVVFYQGQGSEGALVQNEIYVKDNGQWLLVKERNEEFGVLMMAALHSTMGGITDEYANVIQRVLINGSEVTGLTSDFFRTGQPIWFIPSDFAVLGADKIELSFPSAEAELKLLFELDDLTDDPKVTVQAEFAEDGAYSFLLFSGDGVAYEDYETVTAPLLYVKKTVPDRPVMIPESFLFTPMATLHYTGSQSRVPGKVLTSGVVMDPESVPQDYAYPDTSHFGLVLRDQDGDIRPQLVAPMFGNADSLFEAGDSYEVSFRIINRFASWYDTFKHVTGEMYNFTDLRTNYFHSVNEAIYNATDLMMDDDYGGWDPVNMAHYNMEERDMTTVANAMTAVQRYLLTGDEDILDKRAVPTLAFMLSRLNYHFKTTGSQGGSTYAPSPAPIGGPVANYSAAVFGGLYEMTQGRMPSLLDTAVRTDAKTVNLKGITDQMAMYKYTGDPEHLLRTKALADRYLASYPNVGANREVRFVNSFVYGDYIPMVAAFLAAYEATGEQKYLDAAEDSGRLLATGIWTTGYHSDYATTNYTVIPETASVRPLFAERFNYWWHGDRQWRLGNVDGEAKPPQEAGPPLQLESAPGWLPAKAGLGTEHPRTPGHGNVISMNNWAGMLVKLSEYTGDSYFETMARNAIVGRYGNYPGYYQDRYLFHTMKADYPYTGPDYTSIYWHHIPVFISMLEDFLINSAWAKSERSIAFPSLYQSGYAYFASNQYGHAPGVFYEEEEMWLWLDRGIIEPDSVEIDYLAARKEGKLGLALMNEGNLPRETVIELGEKVPGGATYSGTATVYEADGTESSVAVVDGQFTLEIPAKGIRSVVLSIPGMQAPGYARTDVEYSNNLRQTVSEHTRGKGHVIQLEPDSYYAYVYVSDMNDKSDKVSISYQVGNTTSNAEKVGYPYEFLIKVEDPNAVFTYELTAEKGGQNESLGGGTLHPTDFASPGVSIPEEGQFEPIELSVITSGTGSGRLRFVVDLDAFPFAVSENLLKDLRVTGTLTPASGPALELDSTIIGNEVRPNGTTVLVVRPTDEVPLVNYQSYAITLTIHPRPKPGNFEPFALSVISAGRASGHNRMVVSAADFPFAIAGNTLSGYRVTGVLKHKTNGSALVLDSVISGNEMRANNQTVLVIAPTLEVPYRDYNDYEIELAIHPFAPDAAPLPASAELSHNQGTGGMADGFYDVTMNLWYGNNAGLYQLYENGVLIDTQWLTMNSPAAQTAVTSVTYRANGTYRYHARLANAFGETVTPTVIVEVTEASPAPFVLSHDNWAGSGEYTVTMNMWWGRNGTTYRLFENGVLIDTQALPDQSPMGQSVATELHGRSPGVYAYRAELANYAGTVTSEAETVVVNGAPLGE
ncbi:hypothetical protein B1748_31765 [Paenibacillus sp. MY03]|uniref:hypothetical protein n=1 Tax=Paenibacillus sp. MY03 TaxID=302980 RepID=UPI000B3BF3DA|nr:hypothetical protein [Paenibacillus sp. MY03]OUS69196.1 hypothetical protein B1748_31765 [Paenibacillus sp. MY03]